MAKKSKTGVETPKNFFLAKNLATYSFSDNKYPAKVHLTEKFTGNRPNIFSKIHNYNSFPFSIAIYNFSVTSDIKIENSQNFLINCSKSKVGASIE